MFNLCMWIVMMVRSFVVEMAFGGTVLAEKKKKPRNHSWDGISDAFDKNCVFGQQLFVFRVFAFVGVSVVFRLSVSRSLLSRFILYLVSLSFVGVFPSLLCLSFRFEKGWGFGSWQTSITTRISCDRGECFAPHLCIWSWNAECHKLSQRPHESF